MTEDKDLEAEFRVEGVIPQKEFFLKRTFTALKYPNYKLWFWGQMTSLLGTWMQITAQGFLVYDLTKSPVYLGYVGFASGLPTWIFMLFGGVIADRFRKRNVLVITQSSMMVLAAVLAALTFLNIVQPWEIIALAFLLGIANSFDAPSRISLVNELVPREDLTNAIALNATLFNTASATGPAIAGVTYALAGPAWCFTVNAVSFLGVITALKKMKLTEIKKERSGHSAVHELKEGIGYIKNNFTIRTLIVCVGVMSLFGISVVTLFPAWAVKILGGDAATNGFLQSARGIGALLGALSIASLGRFKFRGKLFTAGFLVFPVLTLIFSFIRWLPLSLAVLFGMGGALILTMNIANSLVQTLVPDHIRGRVMGVYTFTFFGLMPLGALLMGTIAEHLGSPMAILISSITAFTVAALVYIFAPYIRKLE
jgi:MFS family permease